MKKTFKRLRTIYIIICTAIVASNVLCFQQTIVGATPKEPYLIKKTGEFEPLLETSIDNTLYFTLSDSGSDQLWKSDGSVAGTEMVKSFSNSELIFICSVNTTLYLSVNDGADHSGQLWKSDGTTAGTEMVKIVSVYGEIKWMTLIGNSLYFTVRDHTDNSGQLWKSDGTTAGTEMVKKIEHSDFSLIDSAGSTLYFTVYDTTDYSDQLWKSDGTTAGTEIIKNFGSENAIDSMTPIGNSLYFIVRDHTDKSGQLWKSNGTTAGTEAIKSFSGAEVRFLAPVGDSLYFLVNTDDISQLWKFSGADAGTEMVKSFGDSYVYWMASAGSTLYFEAEDSTGFSLWAYETSAVPVVVAEGLGAFDVTADAKGVAGSNKVSDTGTKPKDVSATKAPNTAIGLFKLSSPLSTALLGIVSVFSVMLFTYRLSYKK